MQLVATFWKSTLMFQVFRLESKHWSEEFGPRSYTVRLPAVESAGRLREDDIPKANDATLNFLFGKKSFVFLNSLDNIGIFIKLRAIYLVSLGSDLWISILVSTTWFHDFRCDSD